MRIKEDNLDVSINAMEGKMLGYQLEIETAGLVSWVKTYAYSASSARMKVQSENPGCTVLTILPWVPRR